MKRLQALYSLNHRSSKTTSMSSSQRSSQPVLLLMDSPTKDQRGSGSHKGDEQQSLGQLLVDMTAQVQDERQKRSDVEKRNHSLMLEIEQLQTDMLDLKTSCVSERRRRGSEELEAALVSQQQQQFLGQTVDKRDESAEFYWKELQEAKKVKEKALVEAHQRAMQVMELNACISMQHDELKALRSSENEARVGLIQAEDYCKELVQQATIFQQENKILKDDVAHLNAEIGKRGVHFKALMEKWTEAQAQSEHLERENHAMLDKMKDLRQRSEHLALELDKAGDERDCLQHQVNHLKGAVAAKAAESKAFQAYGSNARDHLQAQNSVIQRHQVFRRKINKVARDSVVTLKTLKMTLAAVRAPIVAIQCDFRAFLKNLQAPVVSLVSRSRRFAEVAHAEHQPLRHALLSAELTRRHLHEQLWKSRRNALLICQIRNSQSLSQQQSSSSFEACEPTIANGDVIDTSRALRANYTTGELLMKESERETLTVKFDAIYSDRAREWNNFESVVPVVQSVLDGCNACVATFDTLLPLRTSSSSASSSSSLDEQASNTTETVPALVLRELFEAARMHGPHFHRMKITISYLGVFNECIYDLLGLDTSLASDQSSSLAMNQIVVLEVQNLDEALLVLGGGLENLQSAHERGLMATVLTHKVVTICLTYENLLSGTSMTKSKLQIVELAVGSQYTAVQEHDWDDRSKLKALVTMENGVNALVTALAEVRAKDPAFVRYHSSKLTVLLQDTVKASAKFLAIVALPVNIPPGDEGKVSTVIRSIQQFRSAVSVTSTVSPWGKTGAAGSRDRSLEGFMSRFAQQQQQQQQAQNGAGDPSALSLLFSSGDIQERARQALDVNGDGAAENVKWEKELDNMNKRYGPDVDLFATSFFQPSNVPTAESVHDSVTGGSYQNGPVGDRSAGPPGFDDDSDDDSLTGDPQQQQHSLTMRQGDARIHPQEYEMLSNPPPAPVSTTSGGSMSRRAKSSSNGRAHSSTKSTLLRVASARLAANHARVLPDKNTKLKKQSTAAYQSATTSASRPATSTYSARVAAKPSSSSRATTLAPPNGTRSASASALMLKIRRETASSALKKSRLAAIVAAASPFARQQKKRTPFK